MSFTFNFTRDQVADIIKGNPYIDHWYEALNEILPDYEINTPQRVTFYGTMRTRIRWISCIKRKLKL